MKAKLLNSMEDSDSSDLIAEVFFGPLVPELALGDYLGGIDNETFESSDTDRECNRRFQ